MSHRVEMNPDGAPTSVEFGWQYEGESFALRAKTSGAPRVPTPGSLEEFIAEHYWGYVRQRDVRSLEYQVEHPPWRLWTAADAAFEGDATRLYGEAFAAVLRQAPASAFLAEGSPVTVFRGGRL